MSNSNYAWNQGRSDASSGKGPSNVSKAPTPVRESYTSGYNSQK